MQVISDRKLLTCRYWAFGPRCPNIDADGVDSCQYAHWDTGKLSSFYQQRGTCWHWAHPRLKCYFGAGCTFEHRETGFMGIHHGVLELSALNFHIADAARKSGFDTRNHIALLDLIWSVRRMAFNHGVSKPRLHPPPKHPIYPDRYRPGAERKQCKNTCKRARETEAQAQGTASNPIDLDANSSDHQENSPTRAGPKRQRTAFGLIPDPTAKKHAIGPLNPIHPSRFTNSRLRTFKAEGKENVPTTSTRDIASTRPLNHPQARGNSLALQPRPLALVPSTSIRQPEPFRPRSQVQVFNQEQQTVYELCRVSQTLADNLDSTRKCQHVMKTLYDTDDRIRHPDIFDLLVELRNEMEDSEKSNVNALRDVDHIIAFLKSGARGSAVGTDEID